MGKIYISEVLTEARRWIGYHEKASPANLDDFEANAGNANWTIFAKILHEYGFYNGNKNGFAWCAPWVAFILLAASGWDADHTKEALYYTGPYGASCTYSVGYYKAAGAWHTDTPEPGDQIFFGTTADIQHTGLVERVADGKVYTIEGNAGNAVREKEYMLEAPNIVGYGRPRYDGDAPPQTEEPYADVPVDAYYREAVLRCLDQGIMVGTGEGRFSPERAVTRGEMAVIVMRIIETLS